MLKFKNFLLVKILSISTIPLLPHLGSGKTRIAWTSGLRALGHDVLVIEPNEIDFLPFLSKAKYYRQGVGIFLKVKKLLKSDSFDIIELYGDQYWILLIWLKLFRKNRPLLVAHTDGFELCALEAEKLYWSQLKGISKWLRQKIYYRISKLNFELSDKFVCGCENDLQYALGNKIYSSDSAKCVFPGIDNTYHEIPFQPHKEKSVIYLGSWISRKGINVIPKVMSNILAKHADCQFHIYGSGNDRVAISKHFPKELLPQIFIYDKLPQEDIISALIRSSVFFFPTYYEGFGLATIEAMSCSCVAITTPTGIGSNLINKRNALICEFGDISSMTSAINVILSDDTERIKLSKEGYTKAKEFLWDLKVKELENTYLDWIRK